MVWPTFSMEQPIFCTWVNILRIVANIFCGMVDILCSGANIFSLYPSYDEPYPSYDEPYPLYDGPLPIILWTPVHHMMDPKLSKSESHE